MTEADSLAVEQHRLPISSTVLECLLGLLTVWFVFPALVAQRVFPCILPGVRYASHLTREHLLHLCVMLLLYGVLRARNGGGRGAAFWAGLHPAVKGLALFTLCFGVYMQAAWHRPISGDTVPAKLIPISLIEQGNLDLDEFTGSIFAGHRYAIVSRDGHYYSAYPLAVGLSATPVYLLFRLLMPATFATWRLTYAIPEGDGMPHVPLLLEQVSAAAICAAAVLTFFLLARRLRTPGLAALFVTLAFAFGTPMLSSAGWALWTHGPSLLTILLALCCLEAPPGRGGWRLLAAGACAGWAVACRPTNIPAMGLLVLYAFLKHGRAAWRCAAGLFVIAALAAALNLAVYGQWLGGYQQHGAKFTWPNPLVSVLLLISPSRGVLVFCPFLVVVLVGAARRLREPVGLHHFCLCAALAELGLYACWRVWGGGYSFGPRLLAECIGYLCVAALVVFARPRATGPILQAAFAVCALFSIYLHGVGILHGDKDWNGQYFRGQQTYAKFTQVRNSQLLWTLTDIKNDPHNDWRADLR